MLAMLTQVDGTQNGAALIDALTTVLRNVTKEETVQYVLALLDDIVTSELLLPRPCFAPSPCGQASVHCHLDCSRLSSVVDAMPSFCQLTAAWFPPSRR